MAYLGATTVAASATTTFTPSTYNSLAGLESCSYHTISIGGSGTATIRFKHADQSAFQDAATGVSGDYDTYLIRGATEIQVEETGGANSVIVSINSFEE